jgi:protein tyrosine/serine phosphatase
MRSLVIAGLLLGLAGVPSCAWNDELAVTRVDAGLYRGKPPRSAADFEQLRAKGVKTIVDLQSFVPQVSASEERLAAEHGITYRNCPVSPLSANPEEIEAAYRQLTARENQPLYVHCYTSRDRTSLLVGLYRVRSQGWQPQAAYDEMQRSGLRDFLVYYHKYFWDNTRSSSSQVAGAPAPPSTR